MSEIGVIPFGENAKFRVRKDKIVATVNTPGSNHTDIYIEGMDNPQHIYNYPSDKVIDIIWGNEGN